MHFVPRRRLNARSVPLLWGLRDRVSPEYDGGLTPFQAGGLRNCGEGSGWRLFFNAALLKDGFHGSLSAAAIHVGGSIADALRRTHGIGE